MEKTNSVEIPGTGISIELGYEDRVLPALVGQESKTIRVRKKLPIQFREIAEGSPEGAIWMLPAFGPHFDPEGSVFLGRALRQVGAAMHGAAWTGNELAVNHTLAELPDRCALSSSFAQKTSNDFAALDLLGKQWSAMAVITEMEWRKAQALREEALDIIRPARHRVATVLSALQSSLAKGDLVARLQHVQGGSLSQPRPASEWLVPHATLLGRLMTCAMDPERPFAADGKGHWIFLERHGVDRLLGDIRKRVSAPSESDPRPVTMRTHLEAFKARVRDAVKARPDGPSERDSLIKEGREIYRLSKELAERGFKEAIDTAGVTHEWSKRGPVPKKS